MEFNFEEFLFECGLKDGLEGSLSNLLVHPRVVSQYSNKTRQKGNEAFINGYLLGLVIDKQDIEQELDVSKLDMSQALNRFVEQNGIMWN
jgi:hypothetical protein